jgi:hypothetical protein
MKGIDDCCSRPVTPVMQYSEEPSILEYIYREHSHQQPISPRKFSHHILTMKLASTVISLAALFSVAYHAV